MPRINTERHLQSAVRIAECLQRNRHYGNASPYTGLDHIGMALKGGAPPDDIRVRMVVGTYLERDPPFLEEYERLTRLAPTPNAIFLGVIRDLRQEQAQE